MDRQSEVPLPSAFHWLAKKRVFGTEPSSQLEPWYLLPEGQRYWLDEAWSSDEKLLVFARHQGCDLLACLKLDTQTRAFMAVYVVQGWTPEGFAIIEKHGSMWAWLKSVIDDIQEWAEAADL